MSIIGYKCAYCQRDADESRKVAIVVLDINKSFNPNNMSRKDIVDFEYAKYRCKRAYVLKIYEWKTKKSLQVAFSTDDSNFMYEVGKYIEEPDFNLEEGCSRGIDYFLNIKPVKYRLKDVGANGMHKHWHDNGAMYFSYEIRNGEYQNAYHIWHRNGQLATKGNYFYGKIHGKVMQWYNNGNPECFRNYKHGVLEGIYKVWYISGQLQLECIYIHNVVYDVKKWDSNGNVIQ